jgi:hypothetical protein
MFLLPQLSLLTPAAVRRVLLSKATPRACQTLPPLARDFYRLPNPKFVSLAVKVVHYYVEYCLTPISRFCSLIKFFFNGLL